VGEFPANVSAVATLREYLDTWYANGYAGAWPWAFRADAMWGTPDPATFQSWAEANKPAVDIPAPEGAPTAEVLSYTVEEGDTLTWIAAQFGTTTQALIEVNSLSSTVIRPGQKLVIPGRGVTRATMTPTAP
jgi:LysM repeat protein